MRTIEEWILHWREKRAELVEARRSWEQASVPAATGVTDPSRERIRALEKQIAHHDRLIASLLEKRRAGAA